MRLSTAMRRGAKKKNQIYGSFFNSMGTCALGAALDGIEELEKWYQNGSYRTVDDVLVKAFPILNKYVRIPIPQYSRAFSLRAVIMELNDKFHWTRERIATWIEKDVELPLLGPDPSSLLKLDFVTGVVKELNKREEEQLQKLINEEAQKELTCV